MHYTPRHLRTFLAGEQPPASRDLGPWPMYLLTAVVGVLTIPDTLFELTQLTYFAGWKFSLGAWAVQCSLVAAFLGGLRVLYMSLSSLFEGRVGADLAVAIAAIAAILLGETWVAAEVAFIALLGECLEGYIYARATRELEQMLELAPPIAHVVRGGVEVDIPLAEVQTGETVVIRPGERVSVDGKVLTGASAVDQSVLTGESLPLDKRPGHSVFAGTLNQFGALTVLAERVGPQTALGQVFRLVAAAQQDKAPIERLADRYARWFLPVVLVLAGLTFAWTNYGRTSWNRWEPTLTVLVSACPCALILATPAAVFAAMGWLARRGVVLKSSATLERLASIDAVAFDKTGTLTTGQPGLAQVVPLDPAFSPDELLRLAAAAESRSEHVLGRMLVAEAQRRGLSLPETATFLAHPGAGVVVDLAGERPQRVVVGTQAFVESQWPAAAQPDAESQTRLTHELAAADERGETPIVVMVDGRLAGLLCAIDAVRPEAAETLAALRAAGLRRMALITGERAAVAARVAQELGPFEAVVAGQLPADKARWLAAWKSSAGDSPAPQQVLAMVGDGINDAPALAVADVGLAIGRIGSDLAADAGDIVLLGPPLAPLPGLVRLSRETVRVIRQNIVIFAFGVNLVALVLANLGWLTPIAGAFYHLAGSVLVLLNSMRLLWFERWHELWIGRAAAALDRTAERATLAAALDWWHLHGGQTLRWGAVAALALWSVSNLQTIGPDEHAVVTRYGRYREQLGPGLVWRLPVPLERVYRVRVDEIRSVELGSSSPSSLRLAGDAAPAAAETAAPRPTAQALGPAGEMPSVEWGTVHEDLSPAAREATLYLTGDEVLVEISATVHFQIRREGVYDYLFTSGQPERLLAAAAEHALRAAAARQPLDRLLTAGRQRLEADALEETRRLAGEYGLSLTIVDFRVGDIHPPFDVVPSYREVAGAIEERQTLINSAEAEYHSTVLAAGGAAAEQVELARTASTRRAQTASGDAARFELRQQAFRKAPLVTETRLFWDAAGKAFKGRPIWLLDPDAVGRRSMVLADPAGLSPGVLGAPVPGGPSPATPP